MFSVVSGLKGNISGDLSTADCITFSGNFYVFGFEQREHELRLKVTSFNKQLNKVAEAVTTIGKGKFTEYYAPTVDTLHNILSFIVHRMDNEQTAHIIRFTKGLKQISFIRDAEINRIHFAAFDLEKLYAQNELFLIRPASKDSGHNFFLKKYTLLDSSKIYEYKQNWEFGFDKNIYKNCHVMFVNDQEVFVFVSIASGSKKGQWILTINRQKGGLIHACCLNNAQSKEELLFSAATYISENKELFVVGIKVKSTDNADETDIRAPLAKQKSLNVFVCKIDSSFEIKEKRLDCIPVPAELQKEQEIKSFVLKTPGFTVKGGEYMLLSEVLGETTPHTFNSYGFLYTHLGHKEDGGISLLQNSFVATYRDPSIKVSRLLVNTYSGSKKNETSRILYQQAILPVFLGFTWNLDFSNKMVKNLACYYNKKNDKKTFYCYSLNELKWEGKAMPEGELDPPSKCFLIDTKQYVLFQFKGVDKEQASGTFQLELKSF